MWFPGYRLVKGKLQGGKKIRLNVLIKDNLMDYSVESFTSDIPSLLVKVDGFKFLFFYREWRKDGVQGTDDIGQQEARWSNFLSRVKKIGGKLYAMGDANIDYLREDTAHQKRLGGMRDAMYEMMASKGYTQLIKEDTRFQDGKSGLLDHIYTKQMKYVVNVYNYNIHGHDHNAIGVNIRMDKPAFKPQVVTVRKYESADADYFDQVWVQSNQAEIWANTDIDNMIEKFEHKVRHVCDIVVPEKKFRTSEHYAPWVDSNLKKEMRKRDALRRKAEKSKDKAHNRAFKEKQKEVKDALREAEAAYLKNYLNFSDEKTGWRRLKEVSGMKDNVDNTIMLEIDGKLETDPETLAEHMSNYFYEKVENIVKEVPPDQVESTKYMMEYMKDKQTSLFEFKTVNYKYIKSVIMKLKNVKSTGHDGIPVVVYKRFKRSLTPAIARIVNECIKQNYYPDKWKSGIITPIPKKGNLKNVANWRPIVLLPVISRILEGVLTRQLRGYLEAHGLIHHSQHAYRESRGCQTCWSDLETEVSYARDQGWAIGILQSDMTSAFNCVDAASLIPKLRLAGLGLNSCALINSYMERRVNRVRVEGVLSTPKVLSTGSGEGTQLSPLIWTVYILDSRAVLDRVQTTLESRPESAPNKIATRPAHIKQQTKESYRIEDKNYADDINTVVIAKTNEEVLEIMECVQNEYGNYFKALGLKESRGKQMHIILSKFKEEGNEYRLNDRPAEKKCKLLGLTFTEDWEFDTHVTNVAQRMLDRIPHIKAIRYSVPRDVLIRVSRSLVLTIGEYLCEIYLRKNSHQKKLQKIQNILLRTITMSDITKSVEVMLRETDMLNQSLTTKYYMVWSVQKLLSDKSSNFAFGLIDWDHRPTHNTRSRHLPLRWKPRTASGHNSWLQQSVSEFNKLKLYFTNWHLQQTAKTDLKSWLKANYRNINLK